MINLQGKIFLGCLLKVWNYFERDLSIYNIVWKIIHLRKVIIDPIFVAILMKNLIYILQKCPAKPSKIQSTK